MTGQMKSCSVYRNRKVVEQYNAIMNPYESRPSIGIDLLELTRYAKANNKKPENMSEEEIALFKKSRG